MTRISVSQYFILSFHCAIDRIFASFQNTGVEILTLNVIFLGGGVFGR